MNCNSRNLSQKDSTVCCSGISSWAIISLPTVLLSLSFLVYSSSSTFHTMSAWMMFLSVTMSCYTKPQFESGYYFPLNFKAAVVFMWINLTWELMVCQTSAAVSQLIMSTYQRF